MPKLHSVIFAFLVIHCVNVVAIHFPGLDVLRPFSSPAQQTQGVYDLIGRVFGQQYKNQFNLTVNPTLIGDSDVVTIDRGPKETVNITGGSGAALAWGINQYLRNCCGVHVSWDGNQVQVPPVVPHPAVREEHRSIGRFRYYSNVCTFSYSFVWWDWPQWERHLDWLALNGINLPLASVGMEAIWKRVYTKMGLTRADIDAYFSGPAFLAWRRMGNLKAWGGPLSDHWHAVQVDLQHKILARMVQLGMIPVLPTFAGHVPDAFQRLYPNASISILHWLGFNCTYGCIRFVEPTDPLFEKIGTLFMTEMKKEFGLYHAYSADPFNEMTPKSYGKDYLNAVGKAIYRSMTVADADAVWVMQGWMLISDGNWRRYNESTKSFLNSVPSGKLLVLDLYSEQHPAFAIFNSYYGQPFIWNMLQNFGGVMGFFGAATKINEYLSNATNYPNSSLVGAGLTMEGIYQNYPIFQFSLDRMWASGAQKIDQLKWINNYARQRYGGYDEHLQTAWRLLWTTVYDQFTTPVWLGKHGEVAAMVPTDRQAYVSPLGKRPSLFMNTEPSYDPQSLCTAWKYFIFSSESHRNSSLFRLDLVDLTREALFLIAGQQYRLIITAYYKRDSRSLAEYAVQLLKIFDDLEQVLSTHEHFLLCRWIMQARAKGQNESESDLFEYNMRNQITLWGPNGEILDYARKEWAGVISDYTKPRWLLFVNMLLESVLLGGFFPQYAYNNVVFTTVEQPFTFKNSPLLCQPVGDSVHIAQKLYANYAASCHAVVKSKNTTSV